MAKWIYERWDYAPNLTFLGNAQSVALTSDIYRIQKDGELSDAVPFGNISIGDLFVHSNRSYNDGTVVYIFQKTESTIATRHQTSLTKSDVIASIAPTVLIDTIVAEENAYPQNGFSGDYWYVKVKKAFPAMRILRNGQWVEVETGYVLKDGVWKPIEEIYKLQDGQWVQA